MVNKKKKELLKLAKKRRFSKKEKILEKLYFLSTLQNKKKSFSEQNYYQNIFFNAVGIYSQPFYFKSNLISFPKKGSWKEISSVKQNVFNTFEGNNENLIKTEPIGAIKLRFNKKSKDTTKILLTKQKKVLSENPIISTSFFSPYEGEIIKTKIDLENKQKNLIITDSDQISFSTEGKSTSVVISQFLRYGEEITENIGVTKTGRVIRIEKDKIVIRKAQSIIFSSKGTFHVFHGDFVEKGSPLMTLSYQSLKTEDIVQGIPKIEELFEARQTKEGEPFPENLHAQLNFFFSKHKKKMSPREATRKSLKQIQQVIIEGIQRVYQSQGVQIADKHLEIIVRQMTSKVRILDGGGTGLLRGELVELALIETINKDIELETRKAEYEPVILGITKASLETESFISAASFQETTRILSRAAIERKTDYLRGLKENIILGHLIRAGTGFSLLSLPFEFKFKSPKKK
uniref:DNA-directed RNA polymerase n=1 Tax=Pleurastrosarcina brevispinosa TaxID=163096 RepID=A0A097KN76_9CHLO|nr:beta'' subunit of RNA polymerase [Chlorosarcina brevispinosa]